MAVDISRTSKHTKQHFVELIEEALDAEEQMAGMGIAFLHGMLCMAKIFQQGTVQEVVDVQPEVEL